MDGKRTRSRTRRTSVVCARRYATRLLPETDVRQVSKEARSHRQALLFSILGILVLAVTAPKFLPVWGVKTVGTGTLSQLSVFKFNTDLLTGLVLTVGYIRDALCSVEDEEKSVETERNAFIEFADSVQSIPVAHQPITGTTTANITHTGSNSRALEEVREQYRKTVMSVPDYEREYGESLHDHFAAEFGTDAASVVTDGHRFNEPVRQLLVEQSRLSVHQRERLLDTLSAEKRSLRDAGSELELVGEFLDETDTTALREQSVTQLVETDQTLGTHRSRCRTLLESRQREIHTTNRRADGGTETLLQTYLYRDLDTQFPVLHTVLEYIEELDRRRSALVEELCQRV